MIWTIITCIATLISMVAYILTALYIRAELRGLEKDRYLTVTNGLFSIWQSSEFMEAQLWLLHSLQEKSWEEFVKSHRGDFGEMAFHRVGSFYDRVGTLVRLNLINTEEMLSTLGGHAIAVWNKIAPLVQEARRIENSVLFNDFEALLPACHECYVPKLGRAGDVNPFSLTQPMQKADLKATRRRLDRGEPMTLLDVRWPAQVEEDPRRLPGAMVIPPDLLETRYNELPPGRDVVVYCA